MFGTPPTHEKAAIQTLSGIGIAFLTALMLVMIADYMVGYERSLVQLIGFLSGVALLTLAYAWWEQRRWERR